MKAAVSAAARRCACIDNFEFKRAIPIFENILKLAAQMLKLMASFDDVTFVSSHCS